MMNISDIKYDCRHFRGHIPCRPNRVDGEICPTCTQYAPKGKEILIIKLGSVGDVVRTTPLLERLRAEHQTCHITWVTRHPEVLPQAAIDRILRYEFEAMEILKHEVFDLVINLDKEAESCILLKDIKAKEKQGYIWHDGHVAPANSEAEPQFMRGIFQQVSIDNEMSYPEEIFRIAGFDFRGEEYQIERNFEKSEAWAEKLAKEAQGKPIVGINLGSLYDWPSLKWPLEKWRQLIRELYKEGFFVLMLGQESEKSAIQELGTTTSAWHSDAYGLQDYLAQLDNCAAVITGVSMGLHFALALRKPLVLFNTVFNENEYELYGRGQVLTPKDCACHYRPTCEKAKHCLEDLEPADVLQSLKAVL